MIEVETAGTLISTVGFPIFMCLLLFYFMQKNMKELQDVISENTVVTKELQGIIAGINDRRRIL